MARRKRSRGRVASALALLAVALVAAWYRVRTHHGVDWVRTVASSSTTTIDRLVDDDGVDASTVAVSAAGEHPPPAATPSTPSSTPDPLDAFPRGATLTVTFATSELGDLLHNWIVHVRRARLPLVHVIALDRETASWCAANDVPHEDASALVDKTNLGTGVRGFRENHVSFNVIGLAKVRALARLLDRGFHLVVSDVDVVWLSDPSEYLVSGQAALADVVVSSDCIFGFEPDREPVDAFGQATNPSSAEFNTGVLALRPTPRARRLVERWEAALIASEDARMNDQTHFNRVIGWGGAGKRPVATFFPAEARRNADDGSDGSGSDAETAAALSTVSDDRAFPEEWRKGLRPRLYECGSARVRVALLPTGLFPNGHAHYVSRLSARTGVTPTAVHNTYQYSGAPGKVWRFREDALWALDGAEWYGERAIGNGGGRGTGAGAGTASGTDAATPGSIPAGVAGRAAASSDGPRDGFFLSLRYEIPERLLDATDSLATPKGRAPTTHLELVRWQVDRVRDGLALAKATGRALIMPPLLCTCDRWFYLFSNCTNGDVEMPFLCPLDHVFLVFELEKLEPPVRERTFLHNRAAFLAAENRREGSNAGSNEGSNASVPALGPVAVLSFAPPDDDASTRTRTRSTPEPSRASSLPGYRPEMDPATAAAVADVLPGSPRHAVARHGATVPEATASLGGAADDARLLVVDFLSDGSLVGFGDEKDNRAFDARVRKLTHQWCCHVNGTVEHWMTKYARDEKRGAIGDGDGTKKSPVDAEGEGRAREGEGEREREREKGAGGLVDADEKKPGSGA